MPRSNEYTGMGLLIYNAVQALGVSRKDTADLLHISESALYNYFNNPPTDIELLIELSKKLRTNLLDYYKDREPLKGMFDAKDAQIKKLEHEIAMLKKDKDQLNYTIDMQREMLDKKR